ncbi:MAG: hypothetical protein D6679_08025 [Candidatus Hydrogenedentota bacterium]|nr:MAG: hypothetical protein D6679_08025 [Candidatus Hydrogenedentota bacterium]
MVSRRGKGVKEEKDLASLFERTFVPDFLEPPLSQEKKRKWRWFRSLREGERWKKSVPVIIPFLEEEVSLPGRYHVENIEIRKKTVDIKGEYEKRIATREGLGFTSSDGIVFYLRGGISGVSRSKFDYRLGRVLASSAKINAQFRYADFPLDKEKSDAGGKRRTSISKPVERGRDILKIAMQILQTVFLPVPARAQEGRWIFVDGRKPTEEKKETLSENGTKGSEAPTGRSAKEDEFLAQYDVFFEDETDKVLEDTGVFQEEGSNDTSKAEQYGGSGFRPEVEIYFDEDEVSPLLRAMIEIQYEFRRVGK